MVKKYQKIYIYIKFIYIYLHYKHIRDVQLVKKGFTRLV
jgi:hypothetical protein